MLSIIVSSYNEILFQDFCQSLQKTIGIPYQLIKIDNNNRISIAQAYNEGAAKAIYDYLCFIHEDVVFHNFAWGERVVTVLRDSQTGVIGVAGGKVKLNIISGWSQPLNKFNRTDFLQTSYKDSNVRYRLQMNPENEELSRVVCVDGLFMAIRKNVFERNKFDEKLIKGFHCYDLDFSYVIATKYCNYILYDLGIEHRSLGNFSSDWFETSFLMMKKHKNLSNPNFIKLDQEDYKKIKSTLLAEYFIACISYLINEKKARPILIFFKKYFFSMQRLKIHKIIIQKMFSILNEKMNKQT